VTRCTDRHHGVLLGSYLLGSCTDADADAFERHLRTCTECAREAERLRPARDTLLLTVPQIRPPSTLKARVMATVEAEARLFAAARAPVEPAARERTALARWRAIVPAWAPACVLIALLAIGAFVTTHRDRGPAPSRDLVARIDARQAPGGRARIRFTADRARLTVRGFPTPGRGRTYQVWLVIGRSAPRPTRAMFDVRDGTATVALPRQARSAGTLLVTSEPSGGSRSPTRRPILSADA
jgi:anti-sigma-K factor RskA